MSEPQLEDTTLDKLIEANPILQEAAHTLEPDPQKPGTLHCPQCGQFQGQAGHEDDR